MQELPYGFESVKEMNDYHIEEKTFQELEQNPMATYANPKSKVLGQSDVMDFLKEYSTGRLFMNYWEEGEPFDPDEWEGEKCVQTFFFEFEAGKEISEKTKRIAKENNFFGVGEMEEHLEKYLKEKNEEDRKEFLCLYFEQMVYLYDSSLKNQGSVEGMMEFDAE